MRTQLTVWLLLLPICTVALAEPLPIANVQRSEPVVFEKDILPILQRSCLACHSASERQGELVLESPDAIRKGGDTGPSIVPGRGAESLLVKLAAHQQEPFMPPPNNDVNAKPLTAEELGLLRLWIDQGARGTGGVAILSPSQWQSLPKAIGPVYAIALSIDGQYVAATRANQLFIYHVPTGRLVTSLTDPGLGEPVAHRDLIQSLTLSVDGDLLASGSFREVKLWRRPSDVQLANLAAGAPVTAVAVSPDGKHVATTGENHTVRIWDTATGQPGPTMTGHSDVVKALRFTPDGKQLVSSSQDQTIRFWNVADGSPAGTIETTAAVNAVELVASAAPNEQQPQPPQLVVSGGADNLVRTWTMPAAPPTCWNVSLADAEHFAANRSGDLFAISGSDGTLRVISRKPQTPDGAPVINTLAQWKPESGSATSLALSSDSLITASQDGTVQCWSLPQHELKQSWSAGKMPVTALAVSVDGKLLATGSQDGAITLWSAAGEQLHALRQPNGSPVTTLLFHSNGQTLFASAKDGSLLSFSTSNGQSSFATNHGAPVHALAISPNEQVLATAGENAVVRLWQTNGNGFGPQQLTGLAGPATSVAFSADGTKVVVGNGGDKPQVVAFDLQTGVQQQRFSAHTKPVMFLVCGCGASDASSPDVISAAADGVWQWSVHGLRQFPGHGGEVTSLAAVPNAPRQVFSGSLDTTIRRWNLDNGQQLGQFNHGGAVYDIAVRGDGQRLASVSDNHTAKLWNINGQQITEMRGDVRLKTQAARLAQQFNAANQRVNIAKQRLDVAEKDVPAKTEAEKKASETLAAANKDVADKKATLEKAEAEKVAAEKTAIEAAANARQLLLAKAEAEEAARRAAAEVTVAQQRAAQLAAAAGAAAEDEAVKKAAAEAQQAVAAAQQKAQQLQQAVQTPTQAAQTAVNAANEATQKVAQVQKPFNDALAALRTAESAQNLAAQQQAIAARELQDSQAALPVAKQTVATAETAVEDLKKRVETINQQVAAADLAIRSVRFSPDGAVLATAGDFTSLHTWDAETGTALAAFAGHASTLSGVAFLDNQRIVSASSDQSVRIWDVNPGWRLERTIGAIDKPDVISHRVTTLDFNGDATKLLAGGGVPSRNGELHVFNVADGARTFFLPQAHDDVIYAARFSPDGKRIVSAAADKYLRTWDTASAQMLRRFEGHTNYVLDVSWKADGQTIVSASADQTIKVWQSDTGDQERTIPNFGKHVTAVHYIGETDNIASACGDRLVRMHNAANGGNFRNFGGATHWLHCVDITPDSNVLAVGTADGRMILWNGNNGQQLRAIKVGE